MTIIYDSIDNHMALKIKNSKAFPNRNELLTLGISAGIQNPAEIIDFLADNINDYIAGSAEISLMDGLRASIERSLALVLSQGAVLKKYE